VRPLGQIGDKDTENEVLLLEHDVPHSKFSEAVLSCLPSLPWIIHDTVSHTVDNLHTFILINTYFNDKQVCSLGLSRVSY